jgi:hypothetical protein
MSLSPVQTISSHLSSGTSGTTTTLTLPATSINGNTLVISELAQGSAAITSIADDGGNTWVSVYDYVSTDGFHLWISSGANPAKTVTITLNAFMLPRLFRLTEWPGTLVIPTTPSTAIGTSFRNGGGTSISGPPVVTTQNNAVVVAEILQRTSTIPTIAAPYTVIGSEVETSGTIFCTVQAYNNDATAGTTDTPAWTIKAFSDTIFATYQLVPPPPITSHQASNSANGTAVSSVTFTPNNVGDAVILKAEIAAATGQHVATVTSTNIKWDTAAAATGTAADGSRFEIWKGVVKTVGLDTINLTYSASVASNTINLFVDSFSSMLGLDWRVVDHGFSTQTATSSAPTGPALTPSGPYDIIWYYFLGANTLTAGSTTGYSYEAGEVSNGQVAYSLVSTSTPAGVVQATAGGFSVIAVALATSLPPYKLMVVSQAVKRAGTW